MNEDDLVAHYSPAIDRIINRYDHYDADDKDDLRQICLLEIVQASRRFDGRGNLASYLALSVCNKILKYKSSKLWTIDHELVQIESKRLKDFLPDLSEVEEEIIELKIQGFTNKEISDLTQISKKNVISSIKGIITKAKIYNEN